jgi:hypothetical protein
MRSGSRTTDHARQLSTIVRWIAASGVENPEPGEKRGQIGAEAFNQVAAFLDQHRRQTQGGYLTADHRESIRADSEIRRGVAFLGIEAHRHDQRCRPLAADGIQSFSDRGREVGISCAGQQRQIEVPSQAPALPGFIRITGVPRIQTGGVACTET